jgi:hypothetical protein
LDEGTVLSYGRNADEMGVSVEQTTDVEKLD